MEKKERRSPIRLPKNEIKQIVSSIEAKEITVKEVMKKYGFTRTDTIKSWFKTYGKGKMPTERLCLSNEIKRQIAFEITSKKLTESEVLKKYLLNSTTLKSILKLFSPEITSSEIKGDMIKTKNNSLLGNNSESTAVKELTLKIAALETMIDIAEREFKIEIRKKFGIKQ